MEKPWTDIIVEQPPQGARVLVRMKSGQVRITSYDRFCYEHWPIEAWKKIPNDERQ